MFVFLGSYQCGTVDQVPGLFHVETEFAHINMIPLIPLGSALVLEEKGQDGRFRTYKMKLRWKSVLFVWLRIILAGALAPAALGFLATLIWAVIGLETWLLPLVFFVVLVLLIVSFLGSFWVTRAGPLRALELARVAGIPPEVVAQYFIHYRNLPELPSTDDFHLQA